MHIGDVTLSWILQRNTTRCLAKFLYIIFTGIMTAELRKFLLRHLPEIKPGKKNNFSLGVADPELGYNMYESAKIPCQSTTFVRELLLGAGLHIDRFIKDFDVTKVSIENVDSEGSRVDSVGNSDDKATNGDTTAKEDKE